MIPGLDDFGHLPVGGHACTIEQIYERFRTNDYRDALCLKFEGILQISRKCGFVAVLIGGSFPTAKDRPRDMDLMWITDPEVDKETVKPECRKLMEDVAAKDEYGWNMQYLPIDHDQEKIDFWARQYGFCSYTNRERGMLFMDL
jgi:hypothetical protein